MYKSTQRPPRIQFSFLFLASLVGIAGCSSAVDHSSAESVAQAFFQAVADGDADEAASFVIEDERADFLSFAGDGGLPAIPADFQLTTRVEGESGRAEVDGSRFDVDLVLQNGRWWITK